MGGAFRKRKVRSGDGYCRGLAARRAPERSGTCVGSPPASVADRTAAPHGAVEAGMRAGGRRAAANRSSLLISAVESAVIAPSGAPVMSASGEAGSSRAPATTRNRSRLR